MATTDSTSRPSSAASLQDITLDDRPSAAMTPDGEQFILQLINLLELDDDSSEARSIALDLIAQGRQRLTHYSGDIVEDTYKTLMSNDHDDLLTLLGKAIRHEWTTREPAWLDLFLNEKKVKEPEIYERIINLVAEHGCTWMRGCRPLALVILFQYKVFESFDIQTNGKFGEIWCKVTEHGRQGCLDAPALERDDEPLLLALKEFYRDQVTQRLKSVNISEAKRIAVLDLAIDLAARNGWDGLKHEQLQKKLPANAFTQLNRGGAADQVPILWKDQAHHKTQYLVHRKTQLLCRMQPTLLPSSSESKTLSGLV
ncbi:unnamed protein product [Rotaria magnacalcarata]|uniref:Uncharacterized protein n=1 Tax=Rotaria magnacalcarata TaxID=392030 RepID=A0A816RC88_9BILA|nr:unnamed protein product [Rotaria magnacalcarata]